MAPSAETKVFRRRRGQKTWEPLTGGPEATDDRQGTEGIYGAIGDGKEPGGAVSDVGIGEKAALASGILQKPEEVAPQPLPVAPETIETAVTTQQQPRGEAQAETPAKTPSGKRTARSVRARGAGESLYRKVELWETEGIGAGKDKRTSPLITFIRSKKGFKVGAGRTEAEVEALKHKESGIWGLTTKNGLTPDHMRELLQEEGLLEEGSTLNDMWELVDRHMRRQTRVQSGENILDFYPSEQEEIEKESERKENALIRGQLIAKDLNYGDVIVTEAVDGYDAYRVVEAGGDEIVLQDGMTIRMVPFDTVRDEVKGKIIDFYTGKEIDRKTFKELQKDLRGASGEKWTPDQTVMPTVGRPYRPYQSVLGERVPGGEDWFLSVGDEPPGSQGGMRHQDLRDALRPIASRWKRGPRVVTVQGREELPDHIRRAVENDTRRVRGVFDRENRTVYLIADGILDADEAQQVLFHEAVGHFGIREVMGDAIRPFLRQVVGMYGQRGLRSIADSYGFDLSTEDGRLLAAEERLAQMAEANERPKFLERVYAAIRNWLRRMGFTIRLNDGDIQAVLASARRALEGRGGREAGRFQEAPAYSSPAMAPAWYSQMEQYLSNAMDTIDPVQSWIDATNQWKKGKFKKEELEWSGLGEWLEDLKTNKIKKISKEAVIAWLQANRPKVKTRFKKQGSYNSMFGPPSEELVVYMPGLEKASSVHQHQSEHGTIGYVRFHIHETANGEKILVLENIQSDLHAQGKKSGYKNNKIRSELHETRHEAGLVPDAPFKDTWPLLIMKRMIRYAADMDLDGVAWTTGYHEHRRWADGSLNKKQLIYDQNLPRQLKNWFKKSLGIDPKIIEKRTFKTLGIYDAGEQTTEYNYQQDIPTLKQMKETLEGLYDGTIDVEISLDTPRNLENFINEVKEYGERVGHQEAFIQLASHEDYAPMVNDFGHFFLENLRFDI